MNEILSRSQAKQAGVNIYYTGSPCKNGHTTYRYTQSGTCSGCIKENHGSPVLTSDELERKSIVRQFVQVRVLAYTADYGTLLTGAWSLAVMRYPKLIESDLISRVEPTGKGAGAARYPFFCHHEDVMALKQIGIELMSKHKLATHALEEVRNRCQEHVDALNVPREWSLADISR